MTPGTMTIRNLFGFADVSVDLYRQGLVALVGDNQDTDAASSNGAGKTNLIRAVQWLLFERTHDGARGDAVIRKGEAEGGGAIELVTWRHGHAERFVVHRSRRGGTRRARVMSEDAEVVSGGDEVTAWVETALGLDFESFLATVVYVPGSSHFGAVSATDGERKAAIHRVLGTSHYTGAAARARSRASEMRTKAGETRSRIAIEEAASAAAAARHAEALAHHDAWDKEREEKAAALEAAAAGELAKLPPAGAVAEAEDARARAAGKEDEAAAERDAAQAAREAVGEVVNEAVRAFGAACAAWDASAEAVRRVESGVCPECGTPISTLLGQRVDARDADRRRKDETGKSLVDARASFETATKRLAAARDQHVVADDDLDAAEAALSNAREEVARARAVKERVAQLRARAKEARAEESVWLTAAGKAAEDANRHDTRAAKLRELLQVVEADFDAADFWANAFGPAGLPSLLLDESLPFVEGRANEYLETLADGDIRVRLSSTSTTKDGAERERIGFAWDAEGLDGVPASTGQGKKIEIANGLGLMDLAIDRNQVMPSLLVMDEVLDGLDVEGRARVVDLLRSLRERRSTILVVTHDAGMAEAFERTITVTKKDGVATVTQT